MGNCFPIKKEEKKEKERKKEKGMWREGNCFPIKKEEEKRKGYVERGKLGQVEDAVDGMLAANG